MGLFLVSAPLGSALSGQDVSSLVSLVPWVKSAFAGFLFICLLLYIYASLAFTAIGKKAKLQNPGVAWISPFVSVYEISKMHWWPWTALITGMLVAYMFVLVNPIITLVIYFLSLLVFLIMVVIWHWKTFEAVGKPGWWVIVPIALVVLGIILPFIATALAILSIILFIVSAVLYLVFVGIAAWSKK